MLMKYDIEVQSSWFKYKGDLVGGRVGLVVTRFKSAVMDLGRRRCIFFGNDI